MEEEKYKKIRRIIKIALNKMYYIGGSIVLISLIFKFTNTRGSDVMLIIGLLTEALIFFLGAFDTDDMDYEDAIKNLPHGQNRGFLSDCGIDINKYYSEINSDIKKINFKIQSVEMMKKIQKIMSEDNSIYDNISTGEKTIDDFKKQNLKKKYNTQENKEIKKEDIIVPIKRKRGRPRKIQQ